MTKVKRFASLFLVIAMLFSTVAMLVACKNKLDNESTRLVIASDELDGVFNPFFSSSGADSSIVGMTQLSMLSADKEGKVPAVGDGEACAVQDYSQEVVTEKDENGKDVTRTIYRFVLKKGLKFSNGSPLTMRDVFFNLYVYLDPAYTGSATMYSTDIVGLAAYRTQIAQEGNEQSTFNDTYEQYAIDRIDDYLVYALQQILDSKDDAFENSEIISELQAIVDEYTGYIKDYPNDEEAVYWKKWLTLVDDYNYAKDVFKEELENDYTLSVGTAEETTKHTDANGKEVFLNTDTAAFLYNEGFITWDEKDKEFKYSLGPDSVNMSREKAIQTIYDNYTKSQTASSDNMISVLSYWGTRQTLITEFTAMEKKAYFDSLTDAERTKNIKGIRFANLKESVEVNGTTYPAVQYGSDGSVSNDTNEVLEIKINDIDPKAIWNFGFSIAPMYYYSSPEEIARFSFEEDHFGVDFGNINFMNDYVKATGKIGLPVGAGPYKATTSTGDSKNVTSATFKQNNVVYFERNEHFLLGPAKIKYINYQVVDTKLALDSLLSGNIHFAEPASKQENINKLDKQSKSFAYNNIRTNGYGYIGINAEKVPDVNVRRAIMHAINTELCVGYYTGNASAIYRPMTLASWAYPENAKSERGIANEQYYWFDATGKTSEDLVKHSENDDYTKVNGVYVGKKYGELKFEFTIAGDSDDHPAYNAMQRAATILNQHGFKITVKKDLHALKKLNTGDLTVWAAAWGSGIDPDMYQVYHIDSLAGSTANWGYRAIRNDKGRSKYEFEYGKIQELSEIIDEARETLDQSKRKEAYERALQIVMELAVELPTYQRSDLFAYNIKVIDASTLTPKADLTPFNGPLSRIWEVSFVNQK